MGLISFATGVTVDRPLGTGFVNKMTEMINKMTEPLPVVKTKK